MNNVTKLSGKADGAPKRLTDLVPRSDNPSLWRQDGDGRMVMPPLQSDFLDWLLSLESEREHRTMKAWADAHGVNPSTLGAWKKDRRFRAEWERRADAKNISVDRIQNVMNTIYEAAANGDVQAAKLYLQEIQKVRPPKMVEEDEDLAAMSDDDLDALIRELS